LPLQYTVLIKELQVEVVCSETERIMGRISTTVILMSLLASSWATPIAPSKDEAIKSQDLAPAVGIQDNDAKETLGIPEKVAEQGPVKDATKTDDVKSQEEEEEMPLREGRNLGAGIQANEIQRPYHQLISEEEDTLLQKLNKKCGQRDVSACVMLKLVTYMNRLLKKSNIEVFEGLHIKQISEEQVPEAEILENPRSAVEDDDMTRLSQLMATKLWTFVRTRSLRWSVLPGTDVVMSTNPDEEGALNLGVSIRTGKAVEKGK
jgi:hypothetical protein